MRIWSLHPTYLDTKGLVALWRETLLAQHVLEGKTKGYRNHPQLIRFKAADDPMGCINSYLEQVYLEARARGYRFDPEKIGLRRSQQLLAVTTGQVHFERAHLAHKLLVRDPVRQVALLQEHSLILHPLFRLTEGDIEAWEII